MKSYPFSEEEVMSYIEDKIIMGTATQDEQNFYEDYQWFGKLNKLNGTYQRLINQIKKLQNEIY